MKEGMAAQPACKATFVRLFQRSLTLLFVGAALTRSAPCNAVPTDLQAWTNITTTVAIDPARRWFFYFEAQPRLGDDISRLERLLIRPAIGFNLSDHLAVSLGFAWTPTFSNASYLSDFGNENRIWQQLLYREERWGLQWQHRLRLEQRFLQDAAETSHRARYLVRTSHPLSPDGSFGITGFNELFVTANGATRAPKGGFDRNRVFIGPYFASGPGRYEIGYVGEYARQFGNDSRLINGVLMNVTFTL